MSVDELAGLADQMHQIGQYQKAADLRAWALEKLRDLAQQKAQLNAQEISQTRDVSALK